MNCPICGKSLVEKEQGLYVCEDCGIEIKKNLNVGANQNRAQEDGSGDFSEGQDESRIMQLEKRVLELEEKNSKPKKERKNAVSAFFKNHKKLLLIIGICLLVAIATTIICVTCLGINDTYYEVKGETINEDSWIKLSNGKWVDDAGASGTYKRSGENITVYLDGGVSVSGTVKKGTLTLKFFGMELGVYRTKAAQKKIENTSTPEIEPEKEQFTYTVEDNCVYIGEYPQSLKADDVAILSKTDSRGYFLGTDGEYYAKSASKYYKVEPIKWRIIDVNTTTNVKVVVCDSIIDAKAFDESDNNYVESDIREWLNGEFYNTAFNDAQKQYILKSRVDDYSVLDSVWLPNDAEIKGNYGAVPNKSDYNKTKSNTYAYWLRTPDDTFTYYEKTSAGRYNVSNESIGVVPVLKLHLNKTVD